MWGWLLEWAAAGNVSEVGGSCFYILFQLTYETPAPCCKISERPAACDLWPESSPILLPSQFSLSCPISPNGSKHNYKRKTSGPIPLEA